MDIFNNQDSIKLEMENIHFIDENLNNDEDICASPTSNKENINCDPYPLNWNTCSSPKELSSNTGRDTNKEQFPSKLQMDEYADGQAQLLTSASLKKENIQSDPFPLNWITGSSSPELAIHTSRDILANDNANNELSLFKQQIDEYADGQAELLTSAPSNKENIKSDTFPLNWNTGSSQQELANHTNRNNTSKEIFPSNQEMGEHADAQPELGLKPQLKLNWSFAESKYDGNCESIASAPRAYKYQEVYQVKKEKALRQREEEERKAREFHSRPVPNFKAIHRQLDYMRVVHKITVPVTPETVKHSISYREQLKRKEQESQSEHHQQQQRDDVRLARKIKLEARPFHLRSDQRVRERREFDAFVQQNMAQKEKEKDEQRKQQELEQQRELRKMTEFKARPNPFK